MSADSVDSEAGAARDLLSEKRRAILEKRLALATSRGQQCSIPRRQSTGPARLSHAQQRLWFLDQLAPGNPFYNISQVIRLPLVINAGVLERALQVLVERHHGLRTVFGTVDGEARQIVLEWLDIPVPVHDLSQLPGDERESAALTIATEETQRAFDLENGPLLRVSVVRLGPVESLLILVVHHIVADGWSMGILWRELSEIYRMLLVGAHPRLPELPIQYVDFAEWQRSWLTGDVLDTQLAFWERRLSDLPALDLPTDHPHPATKSYRGALCPLEIPRAVRDAVVTLAKAQQATPFMVLTAALKCLFQRYTGQTDLVIGAPVANRSRPETEALIGFFVNSLVVRTDLSGDPSFREVVERVRDGLSATFSHQDVPFEVLVEKLQPDRDLSRNPLFQVTFQFLQLPSTAAGASSESASDALTVDKHTAIFDLAMTLYETEHGYAGGFEYSTDLFEAQTVNRMAGHFERLLASAVDDPELQVADLAMMDEAEHEAILVRSCGPTEPAFLSPEPLHHLVAAQTEIAPQAQAIAAPDARVTARALDQRANRLARLLAERGVCPGDRVAICLERSIDLVMSMLAVLKAGAAFVPIDPQYPADRITHMMEAATPHAIITSDCARALAGLGVRTVIHLPREAGQLARHCVEPLAIEVEPDDAAYVIFTSGSSGRPRAVAVSHRAVVNHMRWMQAAYPLDQHDRVLQRTATSFDASIWELFLPLITGATMVLHPPERHADPALLLQMLLRWRITVVQMVPSMLRLLLQQPEVEALSELRLLFCGGEALTPDLVASVAARLDARLVNLYGPTETCIQAVVWDACASDAPPEVVPIGRPITNTRAYVLDGSARLVPVGVAGELYIAGAGVALGYLNDPDATSARFLPDSLLPERGERMYRTGDRARWLRNGELEFLGRADRQVKLRGFRIELGDVEAALAACPGVVEATALAQGDVPGQQQLIAYAVAEPQSLDEPDGAMADARLEDAWSDVYDGAVYANLSADQPPQRNFTGWTCSYRGVPIPDDEMNHWLDETLARISETRLGRVWEIGCGTGLVAFELANSASTYLGSDFSQAAIDYVRAQTARRGLQHKLSATRHAAGHEPSPASDRYDCIVLNSVVQYFPSLDHLLAALDQAVAAAAPGARIFIGDVRNLLLLDAFHGSVALYGAPPAAVASTLKLQAQYRTMQEKELVLDPRLFQALGCRYPRLSGVELRPKAADCDNELTRFRYDVTLYLDHAPADAAHVETAHWPDLGEHGLETLLADRSLQHIRVSGLTNGRVARAVAQADRVDTAPRHTRASQLRVDGAGSELDDDLTLVSRRAAASGWKWDIAWSDLAAPVQVELQLWRGKERPRNILGVVRTTTELAPLANRPRRSLRIAALIEQWRENIRRRLPEHMMPDSIAVLPELPRMPNGKIDPRALPPIDALSGASAVRFLPPESAMEQVIAEEWSKVLAVRPLSVIANFFDMGGHSLLAAQVVTRLRERLDADIALSWLFEHPTIRTFAERVSDVVQVAQDRNEEAEIQSLAEALLERSEIERSQLLGIKT